MLPLNMLIQKWLQVVQTCLHDPVNECSSWQCNFRLLVRAFRFLAFPCFLSGACMEYHARMLKVPASGNDLKDYSLVGALFHEVLGSQFQLHRNITHYLASYPVQSWVASLRR